jgi:pilus assembly protein CpaC
MTIAQKLIVAAAFTTWCWPAAGQTVPAQTSPVQSVTFRELPLIEGRGELMTFEHDVQKVAVAEPKIADAVVISPREVMINAKTVGRTTVVIWETNSAPVRYNVAVTGDTTEFDNFKKTIMDGANGSPILVTGSGETVVLTGSVKSLEDSNRLASLAKTRAKTVINLLQAPPPAEPRQILLQVKFASIDRTALTQLGFNLFSRNDKMLGEITTQQYQTPRFSQLQFQNQSFSNTTVNFADLLNLFVYRPDLNIGATIKALQQRNLLQVLAEPNLITVEGKEASFLAGGSFPFPILTTTSTGGAVSPVITVQFKPFGIQLNFTPTILPSGAINLKVSPEVSSLDYATAVTLQGYLIPAIAQRRADTEVILRDGESFAIAGLIDNRVVQTITKVPGFGDVPILGKLFRSRSSQKTTDELLVVVTPHFVRPLGVGEKVPLPDMQETFLPTVVEEKAKKGKKGQKSPSSTVTPGSSESKAEFVGPRGHQEPK